MGKFFGGMFVLGVIGFFIWLWGAQIFRWFSTEWRGAGPVLLGIVVVAILFTLAGYFADEGSASRGFLILFGVVGIMATIFIGVKLPWDTARQYTADIKSVTKEVPSYEQRAPYVVANASSASNLQNSIGERQETKSLADEGKTGQWNTLVNRAGFNVGYESVQSIDTPLYGSAKASSIKSCVFDENAQLRFGGMFPHNDLLRAIYWQTPWNVNLSIEDAYSYCDGKTPYVVVPLKKIEGFYAPQWYAYGVALYNGSTGELSVLNDEESLAKIPGPIYPVSLAQTQREANIASGENWGDYIWGTTGYENTSKDVEDPNFDNNSEFSLRNSSSEKVEFVTPLTPRGSSTAIVALSAVEANEVKSGTRNPLVIYKFDNSEVRPANSAVEDDIRSNYSWMPEMSSNDNKIFEIVPAENGSWVASIGRAQAVAYRAIIEADGTITLYNKSGNIVTQSNPGGENTDESGTGGGSGGYDINTDLSTLTPEQLRELGKSILDELAKRSK